MKDTQSLATTQMTIEPINAQTWRVTAALAMESGQSMNITLLMDAAPGMTIQALEQALRQQAAQRLLSKLQG